MEFIKSITPLQENQTLDKKARSHQYFAVFMLGLILLVNLPFAYSTGNDSPPECENPEFKVENEDSDTMNMHDAGPGNTITGICIKTGTDEFGSSSHSELIIFDGIYGDNDCYEVSGIGTQKVVVTETDIEGSSKEVEATSGFQCPDLSHVDYFIDIVIGGSGVPIEHSALLITGMKVTGSFMIPIFMAAAGFGILIARRF